ncbi:lipopolysaccharide biosynthesis protein [Agromyces intestinalis]|uniref:Lipopolysaccharide biosynthesis protein n=1 Tax=Agromyces intestinalis TaxID=2592652 RepID=A0A5C1YFY6_9MICO|nr:lipopolysaccharide biosynthesis protein [Agromyces intestinalis]QEO15034.1 lipopolysaccharide biosynthesis protein [Agromyces intestinalis]
MSERTAQPERDLAGRAASGVAWGVAQKWVIRVTGFVTVAILTRLLAPADFGVVAIALSLLPLVQLLSDLGFSTYLVQADRPTARSYSTAFWFSAVVGIVLGGLLVLVAPLVGLVLDTPEVVPVIYGLAPAALLVTLGSVPLARLRREMRFRAIAVQAVVAGAVGQAIAIAIALMGLGVWALVAQTLAYQAVATTLAWIASGWRPAFAFSGAELDRMLRFGAKVIGVELVALSRVWLENAIIVSALGTTGLGYLAIAQRLIQIAQDLTVSALVPVSVVVFAQVRESVDRLRSGYLRAQAVSYAAVTPIMLVIAVGAPALIPVFFGDQWGPSVAPAQALAVAGILTLNALDQGLLYGVGRPGLWFCYALVVDAVTILVTFLVAPYGLLAVTIGFLCVAAAATAARWILVGRVLETQWQRIAGPLVRVSLPALCAAAAAIGVGMLTAGLPDWVTVLLLGVTVVVVYVPLVRLTLPVAWAELARLTSALLRRIARTRKES